jgi:hypothetical protein
MGASAASGRSALEMLLEEAEFLDLALKNRTFMAEIDLNRVDGPQRLAQYLERFYAAGRRYRDQRHPLAIPDEEMVQIRAVLKKSIEADDVEKRADTKADYDKLVQDLRDKLERNRDLFANRSRLTST